MLTLLKVYSSLIDILFRKSVVLRLLVGEPKDHAEFARMQNVKLLK